MFRVERGSSLARSRWSVGTAGWSRTPSVGSAALCRASPILLPRRSKLERCAKMIDVFSDVQVWGQCSFVPHPTWKWSIPFLWAGCSGGLRQWHVTYDSYSCGPLYKWDRKKGPAWGEGFPAHTDKHTHTPTLKESFLRLFVSFWMLELVKHRWSQLFSLFMCLTKHCQIDGDRSFKSSGPSGTY